VAVRAFGSLGTDPEHTQFFPRRAIRQATPVPRWELGEAGEFVRLRLFDGGVRSLIPQTGGVKTRGRRRTRPSGFLRTTCGAGDSASLKRPSIRAEAIRVVWRPGWPVDPAAVIHFFTAIALKQSGGPRWAARNGLFFRQHDLERRNSFPSAVLETRAAGRLRGYGIGPLEHQYVCPFAARSP